MPRSRARPKRNAKATKVRVKPRASKVSKPSGFLANSKVLKYDVARSHYQNFEKFGLLADANQIGAVRDSIRGFKPRLKGPSASSGAADPATTHHPLEDEVPEAAITYRQIPEGEHKVLTALMASHGEDYGAMARDMRLNQYQHTAAHLRHRIAKMRTEQEMDAEEAVEAEREGAKPPQKRRVKKVTYDPNPLFKKRSKHFN
jgi:nucleolar protein 16